MALTKVTLTVDQLSLNALMNALQAHSQYLAAIGMDFTAQVKAQVEAANKLEAQEARAARKAAKTNGHAQPLVPPPT